MSEQVEPAGPPAPKPGGFQKGSDPRRHKLPSMMTPEEKAAADLAENTPVAVAGEGVLAALRHVLLNPKKFDKTPLQSLYRDMRKGSAVKFGELYQRLEAEASQAAGGGDGRGVDVAAGTVPPPLEDRSTERLLALARERLRKLAGEV